MDANKITDIENDGLNMEADAEFLYVRACREMIKYSRADMSIAARNKVFAKDGKARAFSLCGKYIFLIDFCDLYILGRQTLETLSVMHLGENLSTDLLSARADAENAYISARGGDFYRINMESKACERVHVTAETSWDFTIANGFAYIGTVGGELAEASLPELTVKRALPYCKKNIYSVVCGGGGLFAHRGLSQQGIPKRRAGFHGSVRALRERGLRKML